VRRREFLRTAGLGAAAVVGEPWRALGALVDEPGRDGFLVPMDGDQPQPLLAYGVVYRALREGGTADWLLNHRGGAFLVRHLPALDDALAQGVWTEPGEAAPGLAEAVERGDTVPMRLEVAPSIAVYAPPYVAPWDDAVRIALEHAGIEYRLVWDDDVLDGGLADVDWLHLHHEDFTGQYGKYGIGVQSMEWYRAAVELDRRTAAARGFTSVAGLKRAIAGGIREYVERGGFLFAMCAATETLDLALGGDPPAYGRTLAFTDYALERAPTGPFSTIDGHRVNTPDRLPLGTVDLASFSAVVDPVAAMLVQNHVGRFPDWYGLTTSFRGEVLKPGLVVLATTAGDRLAKYVHGDRGLGSFTFLGGHDPEDQRHAVGDPPTDLALHPRSPGYRLILNNVLFPAAEQEERKT